jgi:hypothetical protein
MGNKERLDLKVCDRCGALWLRPRSSKEGRCLRCRSFAKPASATPLHGESDISGDRAAVAQEKEQ